MAKDIIRGDRRLQRRYPLELDLEYKVVHGGKVVSTGAGRTGNLSSGGLLFRTGDQMPNATVELSIRWPAVLGDEPFIELCVFGRVVRHDSNGTAVRMTRYQFQKLSHPREAFDQLFSNALIQ